MKHRALIWSLWAIVVLVCAAATLVPKHQPLPYSRLILVLAAQLMSVFLGIRLARGLARWMLLLATSFSATAVGLGIGSLAGGTLGKQPQLLESGSIWLAIGAVSVPMLLDAIKTTDELEALLIDLDEGSPQAAFITPASRAGRRA